MRKILVFLFLAVFALQFVLAVEPFGATPAQINSTRASSDTPSSANAQAGNVTEINIFGFSNTQTWQGYFGNVSGTIQLADADDKIMYNWSVLSPRGEIYASTNNSLVWGDIQCFNFTADGTYASDDLNVGATSQHGTNITQLESLFNVESSAVDGVDETFNLQGAGTHQTFYTNNIGFPSGQCQSTKTYTNIGEAEPATFEEVLLYEPTTRSLVFTAILNSDVLGFDGRSHDFQMLVLEDGHGTNTATTPYYFWVELE